MALPAWPGGLPQNQFKGVADERQKGAIRTAMDAGPAKIRRRFSAVVRAINTSLMMTGTQRQTLNTFFITTLAEGSTPFTWTDPVDDTTQNFRFTAPPKFALQQGGTTGLRIWRADLMLEILP